MLEGRYHVPPSSVETDGCFLFISLDHHPINLSSATSMFLSLF
jgi:hypothetical protein